MTYPDEDKKAFYAQLHDVTINVPTGDMLFLFGDFNARVENDFNT